MWLTARVSMPLCQRLSSILAARGEVSQLTGQAVYHFARAAAGSAATRAGPERRLGAAPTNPRSCRRWPLQRPLVTLLVGEHRVGMVAMASFDQSPELVLATVSHLSRFRGISRGHTESDLRVSLDWCREHQLAPLSAQRHSPGPYLRWLQDVRRFKPSTTLRRRRLLPDQRHRRRPGALIGRLRGRP